jgi:hypothetical protein
MAAAGDRESILHVVTGWLSEHPAIDFVFVGLLLGAHIELTRQGHGDFLRWVDSAQRRTAYGTGASIVSILGGLTAIGLAQYRAANGARSVAVRRLYGAALRRNWRGILLVTGLSAVLCLTASMTDRNHDPASSRFIFEFAMLLWGVRFLRLVWLFDSMLALADVEASDEPRAPAPEVHPRWLHRDKGTG